jgi:hypothetical protein
MVGEQLRGPLQDRRGGGSGDGQGQRGAEGGTNLGRRLARRHGSSGHVVEERRQGVDEGMTGVPELVGAHGERRAARIDRHGRHGTWRARRLVC